MRAGRFKIGKVYENGKVQWAVFGRNDQNLWVVCFDETRNPKELLFDLEYDACGYLEGFIEWQTGEMLQHHLASAAAERMFRKQEKTVKAAKKMKNRAKNKMAKKARRRNR